MKIIFIGQIYEQKNFLEICKINTSVNDVHD